MFDCSGIYKILNLINGNFYIGSAVNIRKRWNCHTHELRNTKHKNNYLQKAWNKYGELNFKLELVEFIEDKSILLIKEQFYIDTLKPNYNLAPNARSMLGFKHNEASKIKMSLAQSGKKVSEETKTKLRSKKLSNETKAKISQGNLGKIYSAETKLKMSKSAKAKPPMSLEQKLKIASKVKGNKNCRNKKVWPCEQGWYCKCDNCRIKKNLKLKAWRNRDKYILVEGATL